MEQTKRVKQLIIIPTRGRSGILTTVQGDLGFVTTIQGDLGFVTTIQGDLGFVTTVKREICDSKLERDLSFVTKELCGIWPFKEDKLLKCSP